MIIVSTKVTLVKTGYGILTLTDQDLTWKKSASTVLAFGFLGAATANDLRIPLSQISKIDKYTYIGGGGLILYLDDNRIYRIAFKSKKDFQTVFDYLSKLF